MNLTDEPTKIEVPFANGGAKNTIPIPSQVGITPGAASFTDGFPPLTRTPKASGGIPPKGLDMNGIFYAITEIQQWQSAGGLFAYDSAFSDSIGGYPKGAILISSDGDTVWKNTADNNETNPDGVSPANWSALLTSADLSGYALLAGATFTGNTLVPDRTSGDNSSHAANTRYVDSAISAIHAPTRHVYNAAGAYSPAVPTWAKSVRYKSWGAGAGALMVSGGEGAGGSAGGYRHGILDVTAGGSIDINVGAGGTGHAADSNGPDAGDTVITYGTTTITAGGAQGGQYAGGGANPGTPGAGDVSGQRGGNPYNPNKMLCEGGSAPFGGAGGMVNNGSGAAIAGRWPGGGGGNGYNVSGNVPGDGADGGVIIEFWPI